MQRTCRKINYQINEYHGQRRVLGDISLVFAVIGIGLMITEIEIVSYRYDKHRPTHGSSLISFLIKTAVSISTVILIIVLVTYHRVSLQLAMLENGVNDWRLVFNYKWLAMVLTELLICSIHPIPLSENSYVWTITTMYRERVEAEKIPVNVIVTIVMFLRCYLILRVLVLHSYIYGSNFQWQIDIVQKRNINTEFALKYIITTYCRSFLVCSVLFLFAFSSWSIRVCEMYEKGTYMNYFSNVWFIGVTYLTIGYGDIIPITICGRVVAIMAGAFGVLCTAYVVAIISDTMQLTHPEVILHRFIIKSELDEKMAESAASVVQNVWRIRNARTIPEGRKKDKFIMEHKMKLLRHIRNLKVLKDEKIQLEKKSQNISTLFRGQREIYEDIERLHAKINRIELLTANIVAAVGCEPLHP